VRAVKGDLASLDAMRSGMEGCTHVFHLAASVSTWYHLFSVGVE
jgi:nucleoside-diphosphate-sugar epimerase